MRKRKPEREVSDMVGEGYGSIERELKEEGIRISVIVNNRAGGNAPLLARQIAHSFLGASPGTG
jgi:hypothetical protein